MSFFFFQKNRYCNWHYHEPKTIQWCWWWEGQTVLYLCCYRTEEVNSGTNCQETLRCWYLQIETIANIIHESMRHSCNYYVSKPVLLIQCFMEAFSWILTFVQESWWRDLYIQLSIKKRCGNSIVKYDFDSIKFNYIIKY